MNSALLNIGTYRNKALSLALLLTIVAELFMPFYKAEAASVGEAFTFSSVGNVSWTVPAGVSSIKVMAWGGGGAGGSGEKINETNRSGLGGGAGGYSEKTVAVTPGDSYSIAVGAGGQGIGSLSEGRVGRPGGETRFEGNGATVVAAGGTGGASFTGEGNPITPIGMGGAASGGDINQNGGNGGDYSELDENPYASSGGSSHNGGNGGARGRCGRDGACPGSQVDISSAAQDGGFPGGGGGGSDVAEGGYGAQGQVVIEVVSVVSVNQGPVGYLDAASCSSIGGWAYDESNSSASIGVHFYTEDASGSQVFIGDTIANVPREDVNTARGIQGNHGYNFPLPASLKDGLTHKIYAYGIDSDGGSNALLTNSPMEVTGCTGGTSVPTQTIATISTTAGTCSVAGTPISFTINVSGPNITSIVLEKDTNGDGSWGQVATYAPGTHTFTSNEPASYTGTYALRLLVNGAVVATQSVNVQSTCGGTVTFKPSINQFDVTPSTIVLGQTQTWTGSASKGSFNISRYRAYVVGSTGGQWTTATDPNTVSLNTSVNTAQSPANFNNGVGTYTVRFEVEDISGQVTTADRTVVITGSTNTNNTATIVTNAPSCVAPGTLLSFTINVGSGVSGNVILQKDTNSDGSWGQVATYGPGTHTFLSSENAAYTGRYSLRLLVGGSVVGTVNIDVLSNCGTNTGTRPTITSFNINPSSVVIGQTQAWSGTAIKGTANISRYRAYVVGSTGGQWTTATDPNAVSFNTPAVSTAQNPASFYNGVGTYTVRFEVEDVNGQVATQDRTAVITSGGSNNNNQISASLTTTAPGCVPAGTSIPFMVNVSGPGVTSVVLEKDTNNDGVFGQVASWPDAGNRTFASSEAASYTGVYTLRLIVNGTTWDTRTVTVASSCTASNFTVTPLTGLTTTEAGGQAVFTVVLNAAPLSNVTLPINSSNHNEGTTTVRSLTFTPGNWNVSQSVTITGRDDSAADGNVNYSVVVGPSVSSDMNANGMAAQSVFVTNIDNEAPATGGNTTSTGGGGGGGGGRSNLRCTGFGCPTTTATTTTTTTGLGDIIITFGEPSYTAPRITGPELVCPSVNFITTFLKAGVDNNPNEVRKLQYFLNVYEGANLAIDGVFDSNTENAVKALQAKYADEILAPWGVSTPTGVVYITTTNHINRVYCNDNPGYTGNESISDIIDSSVLYPEVDNSGEFEGEIGTATSTDDGSNSNLAGVGSISSRIWEGLKDIPLYLILILVLMFTGAGIILSNVLKKDAPTHAVYVSLIRGAAVLAIGSVLNVLNTLSYILNPEWFTEKSGFTLGWLLALNAINLGLIIAICLTVLISLYGMLARVRN